MSPLRFSRGQAVSEKGAAMHLSIRQLQYFVAVVKTGNITQAAERLHVAPTALSLQIKAMEEQFQTRLMDRHSRGVRPTEAGCSLYTRARHILDLVEEAEHELSPLPVSVGPTIRLGVQPALARLIGYEAIVRIGEQISGATLRVMEGWTADLERRLDSHDLDALLGYGLSVSATRSVTDVLEDRLFFVTSASTATGTGPVSLLEVLEQPLVFYGERSLSWRVATAAARSAGLEIRCQSHVESAEVWRDMLIRGAGATLAPYASISHECERGEVVVREVGDHVLAAAIRLSIRGDLGQERWVAEFRNFVRGLVTAVYPPAGMELKPI
jgi:LysR family transcriptional regulator, nitrogen assimilation regulatory protein